MYKNNSILLGKSEDKDLELLLSKANRHGIITGATGSGKTITLKVLAEGFSDAGVPVFLADIKGDLAGCCQEGEMSDSLSERINKLGLNDFEFKKYPVRFWDLYGLNGHPIRTTLDRVGPQILSIMLGLNEAQEGILTIIFKVAKDENLRITDLKDLRKILQYVADNKGEYITKYGNITSQSVGVILRSLLTLENQGADKFFGEPELDIHDFIKTDVNGQGYLNILHAVDLFKSPDLYASFLLWLLTYLFETLPEVGDLDKPKIVFFFDEAHLLFNGMPQYRLKQVTQIVKLIRSRGIGLYFISQSPTDVSDEILAQLGNRVQHTLRAYTPSEQKNVKAAADAFRANPKFDTVDVINSLATGEALISFQNENGEPEIVEKATILPPQSKMGTIDDMTRNKVINNSEFAGKYDEAVDNESAYEILTQKEEDEEKALEEEKQRILEEKEAEKKKKEEEKEAEKKKKEEEKEKNKKSQKMERLGDRLVGNAASTVERKILNSILKKIFK